MNFADREYFKEIVAGREYAISDLLLSRTTRKPSFTISRAIRDEKGLLIGVVTIAILPERLDKVLGVERFKGGGFAVVDSKGMLVFRYPAIETTWEERNWLKQYPQFGDALKGKEVSATVYAPFEGKNRMVSFTPIPSIGWAASAGQREEEVTGPILAAIGRNAVIAGLILAMAFFIALSVARRIANPIMMLRQYALALGRGQERQPLPVQSVSELNDLADAFNTMDENVRARETALQESEQKFRDHARKLEETNKELEDFAYTISHDLRAPLRAMNGYSVMLQESLASTLDDEAKRRLRAIETNAIKMGQLVDDLLEFSRSGRTAMKMSGIDMNKLVGKVLESLKFDEKDRLGVSVAALPRTYGDPVLIQQVMTNLLSNAVKFSRKREEPRIEIGGCEEDGNSIYFIKDNGIGFDMRFYDQLFGVFHRLVTDEEFEGTGVGLAIVHRLVTRHGGRVWAEGIPGEGATFCFSLPGKG